MGDPIEDYDFCLLKLHPCFFTGYTIAISGRYFTEDANHHVGQMTTSFNKDELFWILLFVGFLSVVRTITAYWMQGPHRYKRLQIIATMFMGCYDIACASYLYSNGYANRPLAIGAIFCYQVFLLIEVLHAIRCLFYFVQPEEPLDVPLQLMFTSVLILISFVFIFVLTGRFYMESIENRKIK